MRMGWKVFLLAAGMAALPGIGSAQPSNFGQIRISPGFTPDPTQAFGTSGGDMQATNMGGSCQGWITPNPDHILHLHRHFGWLRMFAESQRDVTLVVQGPRGQVFCNDDTYGNNPAIEGSFEQGAYRVWVGSYSRGDNAPYTLSFTELRHVVPGGGGNTNPNPGQNWQSNYGTISVAAGFQPDPMQSGGTTGGPMQASSFGGSCRGWIAQNPDHIVQVNSYIGWMRVFAESNRDATLIVQAPNGQLFCNDDTYGNNPAVEMAWQPGSYRLWVGSYSRGDNAPYSITFTELRHVVPGGNWGNQPPPPPPPPQMGLDFSGRVSNFGSVALRRGFMPDPQRSAGTSGGPINVSQAGAPGCRGFVSSTPDHVMDLTTAFHFFRVFVNAGQDTTLVIRRPDGQFMCNDDTNGRNPVVDAQSWRRGRYLIWVGSYNGSQRIPYQIGFTEQNVWQ